MYKLCCVVSSVCMYHSLQERQMIMHALRDIDQEKVDYFQQGHTHLQTIHATLDPGKYSIIFITHWFC